MNILIVDDTPENIDVLSGTLSNYNLKVALNGKKALQLANTRPPPDLILLDIMMPGMDGYEVCAELKSNRNTRDIPVIFLTAKTETSDIVRGFQAGGQDYITKPFNPGELHARVNTHLELRASREKLKSVNKWLEEKVNERTEQLKKANQELLSLDRAKADFLSLISHEIRTPLNGIIGPVQLIKEKIGTTDLSELIGILDISVTRLERFAMAALTITNLRMKRHILKKQPVNLTNLIHDSLGEIDAKIRQKNIRITGKMIPGEQTISGEPGLLKMCMVNILLNAIKYSDPGGEVMIRTRESDSGLSCEISDSGPGFSEEALKKLFRLFVPGEPHIDENTGLDLALAKMIMDAHDGRIEVSNHQKGGALVRLFFRS